MFRIHGVRISGFGPLFSGALLISLVLLGAVLARPGSQLLNSPRCGETPGEPALARRSGPEAARGDQSSSDFDLTSARPTQSGVPREVLLLFACTIVASLLISRHTWWARLGPQLWWLPILAVIAGLSVPDLRTARWTACGLAALLLVNATLVAFAHFRWEIEATRTLRGQMAFLRQQGEIEVDFQYFRESFGERLRAAGVTFHAVRSLSCESPMELMSVAPG